MDASAALQTLSIILQVVIILTCLIIGAKKGGIALGQIGRASCRERVYREV